MMLFALALLFVASFIVLAAARLAYPFELEWLEGGSLAMMRRILAGKPLYAAPSLEYVAFNYTPFYYWVSSLLARAIGDGFAPLRLVSIASSMAC
ncbi:MAG TPA: hypothetical protein VI792_09090, partial [Candidatus Eisenbacteria bacterium]